MDKIQEIKNYFAMLGEGLISREEYNRLVVPEGIETKREVQTIISFGDAKSQKEKILMLLSDENPHSTPEILKGVYGGEHNGIARIGARIFDLKKDGHDISGWEDKIDRSIYWYQLKKKWFNK